MKLWEGANEVRGLGFRLKKLRGLGLSVVVEGEVDAGNPL